MLEQGELGFDDVGEVEGGEVRPVTAPGPRVDRGGPGGAVATTQVVDTEDGEAVGVDAEAGTDETLPPTRLVLLHPPADALDGGGEPGSVLAAGKGVEQQDDVVPLRGDLPLDLVGQPDLGQQVPGPHLERQRVFGQVEET